MKDIVTITCYNTTEQMERNKAIQKYTDGVMCCDGSERGTYAIILSELLQGSTKINVD